VIFYSLKFYIVTLYVCTKKSSHLMQGNLLCRAMAYDLGLGLGILAWN